MQLHAPSPSEEETHGTSSDNTADDDAAIVPHKQQPQTRRIGRRAAAAAARPTPRCTRSQAATQWTAAETLVLVSEIAALDEVWLKALPSYQRCKMVSYGCFAVNVARSSNTCKRRWDCLLSDYKRISSWESNNAPSSRSYWSIRPTARKRLLLPASFDKEVFGAMDAGVSPQDDSHCLVATPEDKVEADEIIGMLDAEMVDEDEEDSDSDSEETGTETIKRTKEELEIANKLHENADEIHAILRDSENMGTGTIKRTNKELEMANKLHENAEKIHAILRGEIGEEVGKGRGLVDPTKKPNATATEFARRQADELIKSFGVLVSILDHFAELIRNGKCDGSSLMNPMTP